MAFQTRWLIVVLLLVGGMATTAQAQTRVENNVTTATLLTEHSQVTAGSSIWLAVELETKPHWHSYWKNSGDSGMASTLQWELPAGATASDIHWLPPQRIEFSGLYNYGYEGKTALLTSVQLPDDLTSGTHQLTVNANWLVCKDICIPEAATLSTQITIGDETIPADQTTIRDYMHQLPTTPELTSGYAVAGNDVTLSFDLAAIDEVERAWWYPIDDGIITNDSDQRMEKDGTTLRLIATRSNRDIKPEFAGLLELKTKDGQTQYLDIAAPLTSEQPVAVTTPTTAPTSNLTFFGAILSALLGGIILNLMPCVLPILSLKALSVAKQSDAQNRSVRLQGIAYTLGILLTFSVFAIILIALKAAGETIGWGFQLQSPVFVAALAYLLFLVGLNLSGLFHLPTLFGGVANGNASEHPITHSFFTGILATLLATPCTAPFMAAALGFAITLPAAQSLAIFLSLGLGLALPYLLISFAPRLRRLLPKPGIWMVRFKELMAFPIYASVVWLLWVLVQQSGADGVGIALLGLVLITFAIWLLPIYRDRRGIQMLWLAIIIALGIWTLSAQTRMLTPAAQSISATSEPYSATLLQTYRSEQRPVLVYATAAWCITCKVNERVALQSAAVAEHFANNRIAVLKADWTNFDQSITDYLASFNRNGVPIYVYYPPQGEPKLLPQLLTPQLVIDETTPTQTED